MYDDFTKMYGELTYCDIHRRYFPLQLRSQGVSVKLETRWILLASGMALAIASTASAETQDQGGTTLSEVIVTATRTGETNVQKTPIAISAFSGNQLKTNGVDNLRDLTTQLPNLQLSELAGQVNLYIRGIGTVNGGYIGSDPSTTLQIDGVYISRALAYNLDFIDVGRVEVLRGPQGTLYGRNSVGGTVNIISKTPSSTPTAEIDLTGGNYGRFDAAAYVSGPIGGDGVRASLAYEHSQHDPYIRNVSTGNGVGSDDTNAVRGQLFVPLGNRADFTLRADYTHRDWAPAVSPALLRPDGVPLDDSVVGRFGLASMNEASHAKEDNGGVSAELNYRLNEHLALKSLTAWRGDHGVLNFDADSSTLSILHTITDPSDQNQFSEEINLTAKTPRLTLVGGVYYYLENFSDPLDVVIYPFGVSVFRHADLTDEAIAVYGQGQYNLTNRLSLIAGARYTRERKHLRAQLFTVLSTSLDQATALAAPVIPGSYFAVDASRTDDAFTPKFGLNFQATDDLLLYVSATRGFKSGGYAIGAPDAADLAAGYAPELIWAYEGGLKADWFDRRLRTDASVFYYNFTNLQVTTDKPPIGEVVTNAGTARIYGAELDAQARPIPALTLFGNLAYLDAQYTKYPNAFVTAFGEFDAARAYLNAAPKWAFSIGGEYTLDLGQSGRLAAGADYRWQSKIYFTPANNGVAGVSGYPEQQGAYGLLNAHLTWRSPGGAYQVSLIGRNLTQTRYLTSTASYRVAISGLPGDPRTYMIEVSRRW
jgi:iron complex outermembrane receptor protein